MSDFPGPDKLVDGGKPKKWSFMYDVTLLLMIIVTILFGSLAYIGYLIYNSWRYLF